MKITATQPDWLKGLGDFVRRFFRNPNTNIRVKTIQSLVRIMDMNRACYEDEIIDHVVMQEFSKIHLEPNLLIRVAVSKALIEFVRHCDSKRCCDILEILEKIINRPFDLPFDQMYKNEGEIQDVTAVVDGLIEVFIIKLYRLPSSHAIKIFNILVGHLELHYQKPKVFEHVNLVRYKVSINHTSIIISWVKMFNVKYVDLQNKSLDNDYST